MEDNVYFSQNHGTVVKLLDGYWWIGILTDFSSGAHAKNGAIAISHISDLRNLVGKPYILRELTNPYFESDNIRSLTVFETQDKLYVYYQCCLGGDVNDNSVGKDYINCLVISRDAEPIETSDIAQDIIRITHQPQDVDLSFGEEATLLCEARAQVNEPLNYTWLDANTGEPIEGGTGPEFILPKTDTCGMYQYVCEVSGTGLNSVKSRTVKVNVTPQIEILEQPEDVTIYKGNAARLVCRAEANDGEPVSYQWRYAISGAPQENGQSPEFDVPDDRPLGVTQYRCEVTARGTIVSSRVVTVTVIEHEEYSKHDAEHQYKCEVTAPDNNNSSIATVTVTPSTKPRIVIDQQPAHIGVAQGSIDHTLSILATCTDESPVSYQWFSNSTNRSSDGVPIDGATEANFALPADLTPGAYYYYCEVYSPTAETATSNSAVVLVNLPVEIEPEIAIVDTERATIAQIERNLLINDLYRHGRNLTTVVQNTSFLSLQNYDAIVARSLGLDENLYQQQFRYVNNQTEDDKAYYGGFDTVAFIMNNGEYDTAISCELGLDGLLFTKAPDLLSITFTDATNYVRIYSDDKRPSHRPTHTKYEAFLDGVQSSGILGMRHNILAHPSVLYSPRFRIDKNHNEISLWACDQMMQSVKIDGLSSLGETRVELRFQSAKAEDVSMLLRQITLRVDY